MAILDRMPARRTTTGQQAQVSQPAAPTPSYGGANPGLSGDDPRGRLQNESAYQKERFENQQGPAANNFAFQTGRANEADYANYTDIMNRYRGLADPGGSSVDSGGAGGSGFNAMGMYTPFTVSPGIASYKDPFKSYTGYEEFSQTGGYSPQDIANMRARGVAPIRAAYANAERGLGQQRALQGGYSPNAAAAQVKMAREQSMGMADASTNVEAQLAQMRQQGRLAGLGGMAGIEGQRLGADVDLSKFNTGLDFQGQTYNADAQARAQAQNIQAGENAAGRAESAAGRSSAASAASRANQLDALQGMRLAYGTTPGMSSMFGDQLNQSIGQGGNFGVAMYGHDINAATRPGAFDETMDRVGQVTNTVGNAVYPFLDEQQNRQRVSSTGYRVPRQEEGYY